MCFFLALRFLTSQLLRDTNDRKLTEYNYKDTQHPQGVKTTTKKHKPDVNHLLKDTKLSPGLNN